jgi:hypothetical protein
MQLNLARLHRAGGAGRILAIASGRGGYHDGLTQRTFVTRARTELARSSGTVKRRAHPYSGARLGRADDELRDRARA